MRRGAARGRRRGWGWLVVVMDIVGDVVVVDSVDGVSKLVGGVVVIGCFVLRLKCG